MSLFNILSAKAVSLGPCYSTYLSKILKCEFKHMRKLLEITVTTWVLADGNRVLSGKLRSLMPFFTALFSADANPGLGTDTDW